MFKNSLLIIEDDYDFAESLIQILEAHSLQVRHVRSFEEAMDTIPSFSFQISLIDIRLGADNTKSGFEIVRFLAETKPQARVFIMTAYPELRKKEEQLRPLGNVVDILSKPFDPVKLVGQIHGLLAQMNE